LLTRGVGVMRRAARMSTGMAGHAAFAVGRAHALNGRGVFAVGRGLGGRTCIGRRGAHRTVEIDERQNGRLPLQP
jgi:hypothetical protein